MTNSKSLEDRIDKDILNCRAERPWLCTHAGCCSDDKGNYECVACGKILDPGKGITVVSRKTGAWLREPQLEWEGWPLGKPTS